MNTYIYSKWKNSPSGSPVEFYSELDGQRYETRKVEVFNSGRLGYASKTKFKNNTKLGIIPVPTLSDIMSQAEFDIKAINKEDFESIWKKAVN